MIAFPLAARLLLYFAAGLAEIHTRLIRSLSRVAVGTATTR